MQGVSRVTHKDLLCDVIFPCLVTGAVCVYRFHQETKFSQRKFFLRYGTGKPENITKELDYLQRDYSMTYMMSSRVVQDPDVFCEADRSVCRLFLKSKI